MKAKTPYCTFRSPDISWKTTKTSWWNQNLWEKASSILSRWTSTRTTSAKSPTKTSTFGRPMIWGLSWPKDVSTWLNRFHKPWCLNKKTKPSQMWSTLRKDPSFKNLPFSMDIVILLNLLLKESWASETRKVNNFSMICVCCLEPIPLSTLTSVPSWLKVGSFLKFKFKVFCFWKKAFLNDWDRS